MSYHQTDWGRYEVVGHVVTKAAVTDEQGEITEPAVIDDRCHVNAQGNVPDSWGEPVEPSPAFRIFANGDTKFYRFDSLEEFRNIEPFDEGGIPQLLGD